ncbi:22417_t:CDS:1, partial [Gigaspora rosea]
MEVQRKGYRNYWSSSDQKKHKASGVGLLIDGPWSKHITKIERPSAYALKVSFTFKKAAILCW